MCVFDEYNYVMFLYWNIAISIDLIFRSYLRSATKVGKLKNSKTVRKLTSWFVSSRRRQSFGKMDKVFWSRARLAMARMAASKNFKTESEFLATSLVSTYRWFKEYIKILLANSFNRMLIQGFVFWKCWLKKMQNCMLK